LGHHHCDYRDHFRDDHHEAFWGDHGHRGPRGPRDDDRGSAHRDFAPPPPASPAAAPPVVAPPAPATAP
jgi:hypothetical protein